MKAKNKRAIALAVLLLGFPTLLSGCWDNRELNELLIVTGSSLDLSENSGQIDLGLQVANFSEGASDKGGSGESKSSGGTSAIVLKTTCENLLTGIKNLDRDSNRTLFMQHNKIRLVGIELAQQGFDKHLDLFIRDQEIRPEVPIAVVDGRAEEALSARLPQTSISANFLSDMMNDLADISQHYKVRLIDYIYDDLKPGISPVLPIIKVTPENEDQQFQVTGIAIFRDGKMVGRLDNQDGLAYIWALGNVKESSVEIHDGKNQAVMTIIQLDSKPSVTIDANGKVKVEMLVKSTMHIGELNGFSDINPVDLVPKLKQLSEDTIKERIMHAFQAAQELKTDIFGFGTEIYMKYPKQWKQMEDNWNNLFSEISLNVKVTVNVPLTGQTVPSLEMEKGME